MSPASRSKSKDKSSARAAKDQQQKACPKPSPQPANGGSSIPASAYNPLSGTFHSLETSPTTSPPPIANGRFRTIDEMDVHSGSSSLGTGAEYDSVSNTGSCSGESEDQKDKTANVSLQSEPVPGADNDKREKIRQRNERKHQRQKERRAHELHEKCSGYLMSRKLEVLAQQLVAMGFSSERATMALILNEGRVEESVAWLFDGGEEMPAAEQKCSNLDGGGNLKIDIAEELARIADMENRFKCTKQEVERAVVACEGDLDKATETLRVQKQELVATQLKLVETGDPPTISNFKLPSSTIQSSTRTQLKAATASVTIQHRKDERDFNYIKVAAAPAAALPESENRNLQSLRKIQPKLAAEWVRPQQQVAMLVEKKRSSMGTSSPSISCSLASSLRVALPPTKSEPSRLAVGSTDGKNVQAGRAPPREPVIMMQRPQSINATKQNHPTTSLNASPPITTGWYQNSINKVDLMKGNGAMGGLQSLSLSATNPATQQHYLHQTRNHPYPSNPVDLPEWGSSWNTGTSGSSSSLAVPSSLGLFTGWGSTGTSGPSSPSVDWSMGGSMPQCDYTNIDWSLEATSSSSSRRNGLWMGIASYVKNSQLYDGGWSMPSMVTGVNAMRSSGIAGWQEGSVAVDAGGATSAGSHEWASPFAGNDLFGVSRQSAPSPTL